MVEQNGNNDFQRFLIGLHIPERTETTHMPTTMETVMDYLQRASHGKLTANEIDQQGFLIEADLRHKLGLGGLQADGKTLEERLWGDKDPSTATGVEQLQMRVMQEGIVWLVQSRANLTMQQQILADVFVKVALVGFYREVIDTHTMSPLTLRIIEADSHVLEPEKRQALLASDAAKDIREEKGVPIDIKPENIVTALDFADYIVAQAIQQGRNPVIAFDHAAALVSAEGDTLFSTWFALRSWFADIPQVVGMIDTVGFYLLYIRHKNKIAATQSKDAQQTDEQQLSIDVLSEMKSKLMNTISFLQATKGVPTAEEYFDINETPDGGIKWTKKGDVWTFIHTKTENGHNYILIKFTPYNETEKHGSFTMATVTLSSDGQEHIEYKKVVLAPSVLDPVRVNETIIDDFVDDQAAIDSTMDLLKKL